MNTEKKNKHRDPLHQMLEAADKKILIGLVEDLAITNPEVQRECLDYLKAHVKLSSDQKEKAVPSWKALSHDHGKYRLKTFELL